MEQEGGNGLWFEVLRRLEDVVGATAAAALVRYAATEVAREAARNARGAERAAAWLAGSLGGRVDVAADGPDVLTLEVAGLWKRDEVDPVPEAFLLGVARGLYLGRYPGADVAAQAERAGDRLRVTVRPEGET